MKTRTKTMLLLIGMAGVVFLTDIGCIFRHVVGLPCLGCGQTRAWYACFQGNFAQAFVWHPLFWLTPLLAALVALFESKWQNNKWRLVGMFAVIALYLAVYVVRMVWYFPHTAPMDFNQDALLWRMLRWILHLITT